MIGHFDAIAHKVGLDEPSDNPPKHIWRKGRQSVAFSPSQCLLRTSGQVEQYDPWSWFGLFVVAILGVVMLYARVLSVKLVGPVVVSFVRTSEIIVSYLLQIILFHKMPQLSSVLGAVLVMIACTGILLEDNFLNLLSPRLQKIF